MPAWAQLPQSGKMKKICFLRRAWRLAPHVIRGALSLSIRNSSSFERIEYATVSVYVLHRQPSPSPLCSSFGNQLGIPTAFCSNPSNPPRVSSLNYVRPPANRLELREFSPLASGNLAICFHTRAPPSRSLLLPFPFLLSPPREGGSVIPTEGADIQSALLRPPSHSDANYKANSERFYRTSDRQGHRRISRATSNEESPQIVV